MKHKVIALISILMFVLLSACEAAKNEVGVPLPPTTAPVIVVTDAPATAALPSAEPATPLPPTEAPSAVPIVHVDVPGEPKYNPDQIIRDCNTGERVAMGVTSLVGSGCDVWENSRLERPLTAANSNYLPAVDIVNAYLGTDNKWVFGNVQLFKDASGALPADLTVGLEIDTDLDSRGEYLILATNLNSTEWTVNGVQLWQDQTGDVGGEKPMAPDTKFGDGYDTLVFDAGVGLDPDLAWVRINPSNGAIIEFAFKPAFLPQEKLFAWWAWTSQGTLDPVKMEIVDSMVNAETWRVDNTCGWIFGGKPNKLLLNLCEIIKPTPTIAPTSVSGGGSRGATACVKPVPALCLYPKSWCDAACGCVLKACQSGSYWDEGKCGCTSCFVPQTCSPAYYWSVGMCSCQPFN
jgi:hypothetical protein